MTLFERVKFLAEKQGKSINDVERELNYSQNTLYRLKRTNPSAKKLEELADYFKVSTDYLLGRSNQPTINQSNSEKNPFDTLAAHAADRNHEFTPEEIDRIKGYIDGIIDNYESKHSDDK
ncbi:helix-turn-helix domain-containing protein [Loigolactobacillus coryniformis]|uniref:helix-turn-helix domain-containing protein n=1 Tax=Loigolactobacillus coryniformis TaxID=1610 RepID=UPI00201AF2CB|nr:helix-turn-helix transcriptional regulator [Loigolactobacillus coryniformis]MCL5458045.1 helix-turn-helix domain-containing protein [Loigolactobacillus coryniformis]